MVCKKRSVYGFLGPSWVLITVAPRHNIFLKIAVAVLKKVKFLSPRLSPFLHTPGCVSSWQQTRKQQARDLSFTVFFSTPRPLAVDAPPAQVQHLLVPWIRRARCGGLRTVSGQHFAGKHYQRGAREHQA